MNTADNESSLPLDFQIDLALRGLLMRFGGEAVDRMEYLIKDVNDHQWFRAKEEQGCIDRKTAIADWTARYCWYSSKEHLEIEQEYKKGKYWRLEKKLDEFIKKDENRIEEKRQALELNLFQPVDKLLALKLLLLEHKSIDMPTEATFQTEEIEKEAWYRGEPDHNRVAID